MPDKHSRHERSRSRSRIGGRGWRGNNWVNWRGDSWVRDKDRSWSRTRDSRSSYHASDQVRYSYEGGYSREDITRQQTQSQSQRSRSVIRPQQGQLPPPINQSPQYIATGESNSQFEFGTEPLHHVYPYDQERYSSEGGYSREDITGQQTQSQSQRSRSVIRFQQGQLPPPINQSPQYIATGENTITLNCFIQGDQDTFSVENIAPTKNVNQLKNLIIAMNSNLFSGVSARNLVLWKVDVPGSNVNQISMSKAIKLDDGLCPLSEVFVAQLNSRNIHVIIEQPSASHKRPHEEDNQEINKRIRAMIDEEFQKHLMFSEEQIVKLKHTIPSALDIGEKVLNMTEIDPNFFNDRFSTSISDILNNIDLSSELLRQTCKTEKDTQKKFNEFFTKLQSRSWTIHDSSTSNYLNEPTAKIDLAILDGTVPSWPQLASAIELKFNIGDKRDTSGKENPKHPPDDHKEAIGQLADRFTHILEQQPNRKEVVGAIASDSQIEFLWKDRNYISNQGYKFKRSGLIALNFTDKTSLGLKMLVRLVTASKEALGYLPPDTEKDCVESSIPNIQFNSLIRRRPGNRGCFVAVCTENDEDELSVIKASTSLNEGDILKAFAQWTSDTVLIPRVCKDGVLSNGQKYIIIKPYGKHLSISDGLQVILHTIRDVATTIKLANNHHILHRDIKPTNIIVSNGRGYLIDWGIATFTNSTNSVKTKDLSATLMFCSLAIMDSLVSSENFTYTIDDDIESLFYTLLAILCDDKLTWDKGYSMDDRRAYKYLMVFHEFERQVKYAPEEFQNILLEFRNLIFGDLKRKQTDIDIVITFLSNQLEKLVPPTL